MILILVSSTVIAKDKIKENLRLNHSDFATEVEWKGNPIGHYFMADNPDRKMILSKLGERYLLHDVIGEVVIELRVTDDGILHLNYIKNTDYAWASQYKHMHKPKKIKRKAERLKKRLGIIYDCFTYS